MRQSHDWSRLVESIRSGRYHGSKFYKPVCLIAAIDLADSGEIDPLNLDANKVIDRFGVYVRPHFPKRGPLGWQPLWYLANDGIWSFLKDERLAGPKTVKGRVQPRSRKAVLEKLDRLVIDPSFRPQWERADMRRALRDQLLMMLWDDSEPSSRTFARALFDPAANEKPDRWPSLTEMAAFQRSLSGQDDLFDEHISGEPSETPADAEAAKARIAEAVHKLTQDPLGAQFDAQGESLVIRQDEAPDDDDVADRALTQQLHLEVRRKLSAFAWQAQRLDNQPGWTGIGGLCERLNSLLERPTADVPSVIGLIYSSALELGSFLEFDNELRRTPDAAPDPLDPAMRRTLDDLVRTFAPWVRLFPTARQADDATGQFLARAALIPTAEATVEKARFAHVLNAGDADVLKGLFEAAWRGAEVGGKAGARGVSSTRNMVVALVCAVAPFYVSAISSDFATKSVLVQRAGSFLAAAEAEVLALVEGFPADLRLALEALIRHVPLDPVLLPEPPTLRAITRREAAGDSRD